MQRHQDPADIPDVKIFRESRHVSCKRRSCDCGRELPENSAYVRTVGTEDGKFFNVVFCDGYCFGASNE